MTRVATAALVVLAACTGSDRPPEPGSAAPPWDPAKVVAEVEAATWAFHAADTALDAQGVIDLLWPEFHMFGDGVRSTYEDVVSGAPAFMASLDLFHTEWTDLRVTALGPDAAVSSFTFNDSIVAKDGTVTRNAGPNTFVWQKRNGVWKVIYTDADHYPVN
jgi:hypothetical protein